ncbi:MAG TPA: FliH/SctL family protein [Deltaproteobacteria bacterium]|mgnify:CR=1 FL=1|nr:FliH/SctL family protein [Deltaproteobacteria bacterium]HPR54065.1 FliH/SctL family protein [Deltaproteobacteria bacterium]HXK46845.1 FliH/SctL family protein [Deltaproteobacteria bacterium]
MSSSRIIRDDDPRDCSITPYCVKEMQGKGSLRDAQAEAEDILKKARAEKESIEMEAYRKGLEQGQTQGQKMAVKRIEPLLGTLGAAVDELKKIRQLIVEKHQDQLIEILFLIAEKIIHREIHHSPDIILETIRQASCHLTQTEEIRIRLHPSDFEYIRDIERILSRHLTGKGDLHFVEDSTLERGGVFIDTEFGEIDASIRSQIDHMKEVLLEK